MTEKGRLITFEGGEGVGKSTQIQRLAEGSLRSELTSSPPASPAARLAPRRSAPWSPRAAADRWSPLTETLLFLAARQDHVERLIEPALEKGAWVLCDRFIDSTRVYQGVAGTLGLDLVDRLHDVIFDRLSPDLTLLLDLPVSAGLARRRAAGGANRFEQKVTDFHQAVRDGFLDLAAGEPGRFAVIDAAEPIEASRGCSHQAGQVPAAARAWREHLTHVVGHIAARSLR